MIDYARLYHLAYQTLLGLAQKDGINASSKDELFGCVFGRDSAITILKILKAHSLQPSEHLLSISKRALLVLVELQGKEVNLESGEEPGKFIHEFRRSRYEHLITQKKPWFIYPDKTLKNYDSIDSTPLTLITLYKFWQITKDEQFFQAVLPSVEKGLRWIMDYGDLDKDFLIEYQLPKNRKHGGLVVQSWTDSYQSMADCLNNLPKYPIAPIEVQAFAWLALKLWVDPLKKISPVFSQEINSFAQKMKKQFNKKFILKDQSLFFGAQALDGNNNQVKTITANPLLSLWATYQKDGQIESILDYKYTDNFVKRAFLPDLFVEDAGIRTMSSLSSTFNPNQDSYHNGSFWPMLNGLIVEGLENFCYTEEAAKLRKASLLPIHYFDSPIEVYIKKDRDYYIYTSSSGQTACRLQAWSAAAILDLCTQKPL